MDAVPPGMHSFSGKATAAVREGGLLRFDEAVTNAELLKVRAEIGLGASAHTMNINTTYYVPAFAERKQDVEASWDFVSLLKDDQCAIGLMLVIRGGMSGLSGDAKKRQYEHFASLTKREGEMPVIVMVSNFPLGDLDFYHVPEKSAEHIRRAIDFAAGLPRRAGAIVTFHLNSLLTPEEWQGAGTTPESRFIFFEEYFTRVVAPSLAEVAAYAGAKRIPVKVETTPVPEFGDRAREAALQRLGNPYPLYSGRGFGRLRRLGLGIALDLCHTSTLYRAASLDWQRNPAFYEIYKGIFPEDLGRLRAKGLTDEVSALAEGDVVHLNDGRGLFDPARGVAHEEGVPLGEGDIGNLPELMRSMTSKELHVVFEINETDYGTRPNLKRSIDFFRSAMQTKGG